MAKLPKAVEADPRKDKVEAQLAHEAKPLWAEGTIAVPHHVATPQLVQALARARRQGRVQQGLEGIAKQLDNEQRGLEQAKHQQPATERISRLLVLGDTGSTRFYRDAEALLKRHHARLIALRLDASFQQLVKTVLGPDSQAKVLLVDDKDAVADVLFALVEEAPQG